MKTTRSPSRREKSAEGYPQIWVVGWEIHKLRVVANIRATLRERLVAWVLAIAGATHKPWFDGWLGQLQGGMVSVATVPQ